MMARKTIELLIKVFIIALVATARIYAYKVLDLIGAVSSIDTMSQSEYKEQSKQSSHPFIF